MKTCTLLNELNHVSDIRESTCTQTQKTERKIIHRTAGIFLTLIKEILEVQSGMFHILLPSGFCHIQAQRKAKRGRAVHTRARAHTRAYM